MLCLAGTLLASIAAKLKSSRPLNSFQRGVRNTAYMLFAFMLVLYPLVLIVSGIFTKNWRHAASFSVNAAIGLVPELLPAIVNANLVRGMLSLRQKNVLVRRPDSIANLGAMTVLCSDKVHVAVWTERMAWY
ncbi:hypothetical protein EYZ11_005408 [Aspergillus tanneri]|uniref:Cation-transporting P-type ATPase C-terminal domain-containing protein n=1 Tax=Aspergillus tanneri TaxID=1220188 RepID=A0A4V3UPG8_9EURO|nr:hypothetical protein EYZ11_005408 [Aspergillus tanneri]